MGTPSAATEVAGAGDLDAPGEPDQFIEIGAVGWDGYLRYLRARGERSRPKMIYLDGSLTLVSPARPHERPNARLRMFFHEVAVALRIHFMALGQTTWRRRDLDAGVEGDRTYYVANEHLVRGREVDLEVDPPPDLAIEVVHTHKADDSLGVYARLGVPEVWVCDSDRVRILVLGADGVYNEATRSTSLPFLAAAEIFEQTRQPPPGMSDLEYVLALREWARDVLLPRHRPA